MKILITGAQGYIGSELVKRLLLENDLEILGTDVGYFKNCTVNKNYKDPVEIISQDIRSFDYDLLKGVDCVVHLAAICNDPLGDLNPDITHKINTVATKKLAEMAKKHSVSRFIFFSSCIMYGANSTTDVDETSPLDPKTAYAVSKVDAERELNKLSDDRFSVIHVRNGTIYGFSERMRFDTVTNSFVGYLLKDKKITVLGNGMPWRPICHLQDVCESVLGYIRADKKLIHNQAFNNGDDKLNYRIKDLAAKVAEKMNMPYEVLGKEDADQRTYKASFGKILKTLPEIKFNRMPEDSAKEIYEIFQQKNPEGFEDKRFFRLKWIDNLINEGVIDNNLFFK